MYYYYHFFNASLRYAFFHLSKKSTNFKESTLTVLYFFSLEKNNLLEN